MYVLISCKSQQSQLILPSPRRQTSPRSIHGVKFAQKRIRDEEAIDVDEPDPSPKKEVVVLRPPPTAPAPTGSLTIKEKLQEVRKRAADLASRLKEEKIRTEGLETEVTNLRDALAKSKDTLEVTTSALKASEAEHRAAVEEHHRVGEALRRCQDAKASTEAALLQSLG